MITHTLIYHAKVANKNVKLTHRFFNDRDEYQASITGGGWNVHTFFSPRLNDKLTYVRSEISKKHPRAKWNVVVDNT